MRSNENNAFVVKVLIALIFLFLIQCFSIPKCTAQKPHLDANLLKEGLLELNFKDTWRYQPGDELDWASPSFEDSTWHNIDPIGLKSYQMPDSLWEGYGWWRIKFTVNSKHIKEIERLYFYFWGAAEVYLYGDLLSSYSEFDYTTNRRQACSRNSKWNYHLNLF